VRRAITSNNPELERGGRKSPDLSFLPHENHLVSPFGPTQLEVKRPENVEPRINIQGV
jgi:hypothetical protein